MLEADPILLVLAHEVERAVVVDVAVLVHLDEGRTLVRGGARAAPGQVLAVGVDRACHEVASAPSATDSGLNGLSIEPIGVDLVRLPTGLVGEYCPLVSP